MLKPFDRYVLKEVASPFGLGLLIYTSTLLIDQLLRWSNMLISKSVSLATFFSLIVLALPDLLSFTIPMATLMGILAGMSRMSSDSEVLALRTMGIGNWRILRPLMLFATLTCLASFVFTAYLGPAANFRLSRLFFEVQVSYNVANIRPGVFYREIPGYTLFFRDFAEDGNWSHVLLYSQRDPQEHQLILARAGAYHRDERRREGIIALYSGVYYSIKEEKPDQSQVASFDEKYEHIPGIGPGAGRRRNTQLPLPRLYRRARAEPDDISAQIELHNKFSLPFASIALGFLGLSLGISTKKGGRASGLIISLAVIFIYYLMITAARNLIQKGHLPAAVGMWAPDFFLSGAGLFFFWLLRREREIRWPRLWPRPSSGRLRRPRAQRLGRNPLRILDAYILKRALALFLLVLVSLLLVFYIINIVDLIDDLDENRVPFVFALKYCYFITPYMLTLILPIAILTSVLLTFSLMSKNQELIAVQVSGISLYRVVLPVLLLGFLVSAAVFGLQEKVVPVTSPRASQVYDTIHARRSLDEIEMNRYWLESQKERRIYFYAHYEKALDRHTHFNVLDFDDGYRLVRRTTARTARWTGASELMLRDVLVREFVDQRPAGPPRHLATLALRIPEQRSAFFETVKYSAVMSIRELKRYIAYLRKNRSDVRRYEAQLYYSYAYPLSALIMAFLAVPFSFLMGNRGALFGIGIAVGVSLVYWGALGVSSALGKTALLPPLLSAFAPFLLFLTFSLWLLGRVKT